jgi:branched-chain amino acid aminotransferase
MKEKLGFVTVNGKNQKTISIFDHGLLYGDGIYETIRVFNKKAFLFSDHLNRLFSSAKAISLDIPYSKKTLVKLIKSAFTKSKLKNAFIRIVITRGVGEQGLVSKSRPNLIIVVSSRKFKPLDRISLSIAKVRRINKSAIDSKIKSLNYLNNILAKRDARKRKFDDALLLNDDGLLTEATSSNLFIVKSGRIFTPSSDSGILEGITRKAILENFAVTEKSLKLKDLISADEVFLSGTVNLITCVKKINGKNYQKFNYAEKILDRLMKLAEAGTRLK